MSSVQDAITPGAINRRGFGLKDAIQAPIATDYHSTLIDQMVAQGHRLRVGEFEFRLATDFGFCYGVDRAVELAYETVTRFPDRTVYLTNEIIHNPRVNNRLRELGVKFLSDEPAAYERLGTGDLVILPAFGAPQSQLEELQRRGCVLVDSTCGAVMKVWRRVETYVKDRFTSIIHGKFWHEETIASSSRVSSGGGQYLIVLDRAEAQLVCDYILQGGDRTAFLTRFQGAYSPGFDPATDLLRVGCANQTTMLSSESLAIAELFRQTMIKKYGTVAIEQHFRSFDTICTATQDRQDAMLALAQEPIDLFLVVGGFNSSNTSHLAEIAGHHKPTYHIEDAAGLVSSGVIRHKPMGSTTPTETHGWLPDGPLTIGLTSGASTPNRILGEVIERLASFRGYALDAPCTSSPAPS